MSAFPGLGLSALPAPFKPLQAYLQRAEELRTRDPIIAYWCIYYAAQVGISLKIKENSCRVFLVSILELLEKMKAEVGANDAIDMEAASAAYVENFALRVFTSADNEDRAGKATRSTAKKFLAAANFLEVLKVFPQSEISEGMEAKIRYAKWKAADISKAFREGRVPTPGPAGSEDDPMLVDGPATPIAATGTPTFELPAPPDNNGLGTPTSTNPPPSVLTRSTPSPTMNVDDIRRANSGFVPASSPPSVPADKEVTPGMWSTVATPGSFTPEEAGQDVSWQSSTGHARTGSTGTLSPTSNILASPGSYHQSPSLPAAPTSPMAVVSPPPPPAAPPVVPAVDAYQPQPPQRSVQLTPTVIAKAQKHCRFAISALDYEDADTARKQLREALSILGG